MNLRVFAGPGIEWCSTGRAMSRRGKDVLAGAPLGLACRAATPEHDVHLDELESVALVRREGQAVKPLWGDVAKSATPDAEQVVVRRRRVGVVALRPVAGGELEYLSHIHQFLQGVVDSGEADLGETLLRATVDGLCSEVDVFAGEHLGDDAALSGESPSSIPQPFYQLVDRRLPFFRHQIIATPDL